MLTESFLRDFFHISRERSMSNRRVLSWNRTTPVPININFKQEALEKIREQITLEDLEFIETGGVIRTKLYLG